jgi:hypothetical protein
VVRDGHRPAEPSRPPFEDREKGYERDFAHAEELKLREHALRNRLLAEWAASRAA